MLNTTYHVSPIIQSQTKFAVFEKIASADLSQI